MEKQATQKLVWTRQELVAATGIGYRTLVVLESRGLLQRAHVGICRALYTDESVRALFRDNPAAKRRGPSDQAGCSPKPISPPGAKAQSGGCSYPAANNKKEEGEQP